MKTTNKLIAVAPFNMQEKDKKVVRGLDMSDGLIKSLISTKVLIDSEKYKTGQTLYFRADTSIHPSAKHKLTLGDKEFILLDEGLVIAVEE